MPSSTSATVGSAWIEQPVSASASSDTPAPPGPYTELQPGLDHLGLTAASRDELVAWEQRFEAMHVTYSPIQDMEFGSHLNFRDPDGIPLEFQAPNEAYVGLLAHLRSGDVPDSELRDQAERILGPGMVIRP